MTAGNGHFGCLLDCIAETPVRLIHIGQIKGQQILWKLVGHCNVVAPIGLAEVLELNGPVKQKQSNFGETISKGLCYDLENFSKSVCQESSYQSQQ